MLRVQKTLGTAIQDGKIMLGFLAEDQKRYDVLLPPLEAIQAVTSILQAAKDLPRSQAPTVEGAVVEGGVVLAVGDNMQPMLALTLNGLELAIALSESQLASLRDDMSRFLDRPHKAH